MIIKILGTGCKKCQTLESKVRTLVTENEINAAVEKVTDLNEMINYGIMMTPGLVIDDKVVCTGIIPDDKQLLSWIGEV